MIGRGLALGIVVATAPAASHEIRPAVADVTVTAERAEIAITLTVEPILAGIDLSAVGNTDEAAASDLNDSLRALDPAALEARLRAAWAEVGDGFVVEVDGRAVIPTLEAADIPEVGNPDLPRDSRLTLIAPLPEGDAPVRVGLAPDYGEVVIRRVGVDDGYEGFLADGALSDPLPRVAARDGLGAMISDFFGD